MNDAINRHDAIEGVATEVLRVFSTSLNDAYEVAENALKDLPPAQPQRMRGRWEYVKHYGERYRVCTLCHAERRDDRSTGWNFCPNCGSDNREEQSDDES